MITVLAFEFNRTFPETLWDMVRLCHPEMEVHRATPEKEGMELAMRKIPDLILVGPDVASMEAPNLCERIRKQDILRQVFVAACLPEGDQLSRLRALESGADAVLSIPPVPEDVQAVLRQVQRTQMLLRNTRHNQNLMHYIIEHTNGGVAVHDRDLNYIYVSRKYLEDYNIQDQDIIGKHHYDVFPDLPQKWREVHQRALLGETSSSEKDCFERDDGRVEWTRWECRPWYEADGSIGGIIIYTQMITEQVQTLSELSRTNEMLHNLAAQVPGVIYQYVLHPDGSSCFPYSSPGMFDIYGVTPEEVREDATPVFGRLHPDDHDYIVRIIMESARDLTLFHCEFRVIHPVKGFGWRLCDARPERLEDGGTLWYGIISDITERKQAEEALKESRALYESLVRHMPAAVFRKDLEGRFRFVNERFCFLKGLTREEILGRTASELVQYVSVKASAGNIQERPRQMVLESEGDTHHQWIITHGEPIELEESFVQPDGSVEYSQVIKSPIFDAQGQIAGSQGMLFDITDRKRLFQELLHAKEKAEESDRLKTAFLHNVSHEIRTPMNAIIGFSELLSEHNTSAEQIIEYTSIIAESSRQLLSVVTDIINIATLESGQERVYEKSLDLSEYCSMLYDRFLPLAERKGLALTCPDREVPGVTIVTDEAKLLHILNNLLSNAIKFTPAGSVEFGYEAGEREVTFYVRDTGIGIPVEWHAEIFKRFRQVEISSTRQFGGAGLGLSISKAYVELLGGRIWLESRPEGGTIFYFTLPSGLFDSHSGGPQHTEQPAGATLTKDTRSGEGPARGAQNSRAPSTIARNVPSADTKDQHEPDMPSPATNQSEQTTILVAEDEEFNRIYMEQILEGTGWSMLYACNGAEAVQEVSSGKVIHLVLMDLKMPVMDGYEASLAIRRMRPELPIIATTAYTTSDDKRKALDSGCNDFISKPFHKEEVLSHIRRLLA